jgi:hypothetical protein
MSQYNLASPQPSDSTNNTQFSAEKVPTRNHHHSKRSVPLIIDAVAGGLGLLFAGITIFNTTKGTELSNRVSDIQRSVFDTNKQLHSLEV